MKGVFDDHTPRQVTLGEVYRAVKKVENKLDGIDRRTQKLERWKAAWPASLVVAASALLLAL